MAHGHLSWGESTATRGAGLLPLLAAIAARRSDFDPGTLDDGELDLALRLGLGSWLDHVSRHRPAQPRSPAADKVKGAALAQQMLSDAMMDALEAILAAANRAGSSPLLLKGASTALRFYPAPALRPMGDLDILVDDAHRLAVEQALRDLGYRQRSELDARFYETHHHSMPFWHPRLDVWVDVHSRLIGGPPRADGGVFDAARALAAGEPLAFRGHRALVMPLELELAYLCLRWIEALDVERGLWPLLDALMILGMRGTRLDWDKVAAFASRAPAVAAALHLAVGYLSRHGVADVPEAARRRIARHDRITSRVTRPVLWRIVDSRLLRGRPFGRIATAFTVSLVWDGLLQPRSALRNLCALPLRLALPPGMPARKRLARLVRAPLGLVSRGGAGPRNL
jgi:hypothetical protein